MDTLQAYGHCLAATGARRRVFDWDRAVQILKERGADDACAGLQSDLEYTGGDILRDGEPVPPGDTYTYLASNWATPVLILGADLFGGEEVECWAWMDESEYDEATYWPESARKAWEVPNA